MENVIAIVPVYNPEPGLVDLCRALVADYGSVVVVDDGSNDHCDDFGLLPQGVTIVRHTINRGKGRAIKTGIEWVREHRPEVKVVVFADGDGQHRPEDVRRVVEHALAADQVTLGVRDFSTAGIPFRSRFGNVLTSFLVRCLYHFKIYDTQTGLRAIPSRFFDLMLSLSGDRYEYEMRLFGALAERREALGQVPIETIYLNDNRASHFHPIKDSVRVYQGLFGGSFLKFCLSSLVGFGTDNLIFTLVLLALQSGELLRRYDILIALVCARLASAMVNYLCNRWLVFHTRGKAAKSFVRYWALVLLVAALSYLGTAVLAAVFDAMGIVVTIIKIFVETILFLLSYRLQKRWVFA